MKINKKYSEEEETDEYEDEVNITSTNETVKDENKIDDLEIKDEDEEKKKKESKKCK